MDAIRSAFRHDEAFLLDMLYEALFVPPGSEPFPRSVLDAPEVAHYAAGFGTRAGDVGFVAEVESDAVGAAWVRLLQGEDRGYGYVDDETPELTVAVKRPWRGRGVGTALCCRLVEAVPRMSVSCDVRNPAMGLYQRLGFEAVSRHDNSVTMLHRG